MVNDLQWLYFQILLTRVTNWEYIIIYTLQISSKDCCSVIPSHFEKNQFYGISLVGQIGFVWTISLPSIKINSMLLLHSWVFKIWL